LSQIKAAMPAFFARSAQNRDRITHQRAEEIVVETPADLANLMVRRFGATLIAVPIIVERVQPATAAAFFRTAEAILANLDGYGAQRHLLLAFGGLFDDPTLTNVSALGGYIDAPENAALRKALEWEGRSVDAVACLRLFNLLARREGRAKRTLKRQPAAGKVALEALGVVEAKVAEEWKTLKKFLMRIDGATCAGAKVSARESRKLQTALQKLEPALHELRFLGFLVAACNELRTRLVANRRL
jgi:hypothetical protein